MTFAPACVVAVPITIDSFFAKYSAIARPIPRLAPVIKTILFFNDDMILLARAHKLFLTLLLFAYFQFQYLLKFVYLNPPKHDLDHILKINEYVLISCVESFQPTEQAVLIVVLKKSKYFLGPYEIAHQNFAQQE